MLSDSRLRMSFEVKMNSQYINQYNQSTVETVTAISNLFFKQKSEIIHMYTMGVVVIKICALFYFIFYFILFIFFFFFA